jgi:hypothetical protein
MTVKKLEFAAQLRSIISELMPFNGSGAFDDDTPNGKDIVKLTARKEQSGYVASWCNALERFAQLVENQKEPLTERQVDLIGSNLFRGMGSFADFWLDERVFGPEASAANDRLRVHMHRLYSTFKD